ncbi:hypothetical protein PD653_1480, partial [Nocardioides sp. PD653]
MAGPYKKRPHTDTCGFVSGPRANKDLPDRELGVICDCPPSRLADSSVWRHGQAHIRCNAVLAWAMPYGVAVESRNRDHPDLSLHLERRVLTVAEQSRERVCCTDR